MSQVHMLQGILNVSMFYARTWTDHSFTLTVEMTLTSCSRKLLYNSLHLSVPWPTASQSMPFLPQWWVWLLLLLIVPTHSVMATLCWPLWLVSTNVVTCERSQISIQADWHREHFYFDVHSSIITKCQTATVLIYSNFLDVVGELLIM